MNYQLVSDQKLIDMYVAGDHRAIETLVCRYKSGLYSYIYINIKDKHLADDFFQETFIKIIKTLRTGNYCDQGKFLGWARRIAHNLIIDHYRQANRIPTVENDDEFDAFSVIKCFDENIEEKIVTEQIHRDIRKLIKHLPDEQREVVMLRHFSRMSFTEIAEETNVSVNTALGRMRYALINLRKLIKEKEVILSY